MPVLSINPLLLMDSSTVICWTSPFAILGMPGLFFYASILFLMENNVDPDQTPQYGFPGNNRLRRLAIFNNVSIIHLHGHQVILLKTEHKELGQPLQWSKAQV